MQGYDDTYDVYDERRVTARKEHRCAACNERILPGHKYVRVGIIFQGSAETLKRCFRCQTIHEHLRDANPDDGETWPDEELNCGESYKEVFGGPPPKEIAALAFWRPGDPLPKDPGGTEEVDG
jgi:hypothetical protein